MSLGKVARKLKRAGKGAVQFRFTSTFEYIDLHCTGSWRPNKLRIIWLRSHRRVQSIDAEWVVTEDRGPNGANGRATFDPPISVSLIVTLYRENGAARFDEKEYKYYIENDGPGGKKILASFNCDMSEYAGMPQAKHTLDMTFKSVSKKISEAVLGITLEAQFVKKGQSTDDDMQSTFSSMSANRDSMHFDEEDEDEEEDIGRKSSHLSQVLEKAEPASQVTQAQEDAGSLTPSSQPKPALDTSGTTRTAVQSKETWEPPPNPYAQENGEGEMGEEEEVEEPSPTSAWLGKVVLVDCFGEAVEQQKLDRAEIIGLYFSANWCPPCRRFLPKLVKFYHHLKQHNKPFEILYISSDYSKQEMMKYMQEQQMPWVGLGFDSTVADQLRTSFSVSAIPLFTIVSKDGVKLEDSAKKSVETAMSSSSVLKLYNKWHEKTEAGGGTEAVVEEEKQKKGLFQKVKDTISRGTSKEGGDQDLEPIPQEGGAEVKASTQRQVVEARPQSKSRSKSHVSQAEKDEKIRHLEEVNVSLKQTNDDLNEEMIDLKRQLDEAQQKLQAMEQSSRQLEDEKRELLASINIRGWLFKRGVKGPTASVWRRRYFRCDQGSKIYYYKSATEGTPQGYIDLDKVVSVQEVSPAQQDKNHATFLVQCDGRTYQLQAHDETTMRKWMSAIEYLRDWRKRHASNSATP